MKLQSPALEKRVRKVARDEMRLDKALWKDYKRHRKSWLRRKLETGNKLLFVLPLFWVLIFAGFREHGKETILVAIALYATATTLFCGLNFRLNVVEGYDRALFQLTEPILARKKSVPFASRRYAPIRDSSLPVPWCFRAGLVCASD